MLDLEQSNDFGSMSVIQEHIDHIHARLAADSSLRNQLSGPIQLKLKDGDAWVISPFSPYVEEGEGDSKAEIRLKSQLFERIISGTLNPQKAYVDGKIEVFGDTLLVMAASLLLFEGSPQT